MKYKMQDLRSKFLWQQNYLLQYNTKSILHLKEMRKHNLMFFFPNFFLSKYKDWQPRWLLWFHFVTRVGLNHFPLFT